MRIGIVDDELEMHSFLARVLGEGGHSCVCMQNGQQMLRSLQRETFDLLLLDWNLPDVSGLNIIAWAQANIDPCPPIIMLTSRSGADDIVTALHAGADDFIIKPEDPAVILARIEAVVRRIRPGVDRTREYNFGPYCFIPRDDRVLVDGAVVALTSKEFALAFLFFAEMDRPLSRDYLLEKVWNSVPGVATRTLDVHVSRIRSKLELSAQRGYRLRTIFGYGYRLETC